MSERIELHQHGHLSPRTGEGGHPTTGRVLS